jgi:hypothetical protein
MGTTGRTYREVIGLTGPLLPVVSFLGRLPTATVQFGSVLLGARTGGSLTAAGLTGGALAFSLGNALAITALVAGALAGLPTPVLALLGAAAGATVPLIGPLARARLITPARGAKAPDATVSTALSFESTLDEISFVLGPALVGLSAVLAHPAYALGGAALSVAVCGSGFALHPTASRRDDPVPTSTVRRNGPVATLPAGTASPACPDPSTPSAPPSPSRAPCSAPARPASPRSSSGWAGATRRGSSTWPWER